MRVLDIKIAKGSALLRIFVGLAILSRNIQIAKTSFSMETNLDAVACKARDQLVSVSMPENSMDEVFKTCRVQREHCLE